MIHSCRRSGRSILAVEKVELDELLKRADFYFLSTPLTEKTKNIWAASALGKTKRKAFES